MNINKSLGETVGTREDAKVVKMYSNVLEIAVAA